MAFCVGWTREGGSFRFFSGRYSGDVPIWVDTAQDAAQFANTQDPEVVRFEQRMRELKLDYDYRDL